MYQPCTAVTECCDNAQVRTHHALIAMREQHHNTTLPDPLGLPAAHELVKYALGVVGKVTKLGLPADQGIGVGHWVAQLKPWTWWAPQKHTASDFLVCRLGNWNARSIVAYWYHAKKYLSRSHTHKKYPVILGKLGGAHSEGFDLLTKHTKFREWAVTDMVLCLVRPQVVEGVVLHLVTALVIQHMVTMAEGETQ